MNLFADNHLTKTTFGLAPAAVEASDGIAVIVAPVLVNSNHSADIMALPLRDARDMFETQYLQAQLLRFGGNISRTAQFVDPLRQAVGVRLTAG